MLFGVNLTIEIINTGKGNTNADKTSEVDLDNYKSWRIYFCIHQQGISWKSVVEI